MTLIMFQGRPGRNLRLSYRTSEIQKGGRCARETPKGVSPHQIETSTSLRSHNYYLGTANKNNVPFTRSIHVLFVVVQEATLAARQVPHSGMLFLDGTITSRPKGVSLTQPPMLSYCIQVNIAV